MSALTKGTVPHLEALDLRYFTLTDELTSQLAWALEGQLWPCLQEIRLIGESAPLIIAMVPLAASENVTSTPTPSFQPWP